MKNHKLALTRRYYTTGQTAKILRVSVSTLKRWIRESGDTLPKLKRNSNGWKLFSESDLEMLKAYQRQRKKRGRIFSEENLRPVERS